MKKSIILLLALTVVSLSGYSYTFQYNSDSALLDGKTIVKVNLTGIPMRNFGFSAERVINKNLSVNLGIRTMPEGSIPMLGTIQNYLNNMEGVNGESSGGEVDISRYLGAVKISSYAFTPELRIYLGKQGYGNGFYMAPYYNFFKFKLSNFNIEENLDGEDYELALEGGIKTHSGGLMLGRQWMVGAKKNIVIDWGIFGIHFGGSSGVLNGKLTNRNNPNFELDPSQQAELKESLDETFADIPFFKFTSEVGPTTAKITEKGPWAFLRGNLSVGFRF